MAKKRYWVGVACKDQMVIGLQGNFMQPALGSQFLPPQKNPGDWLIYFAPYSCANIGAEDFAWLIQESLADEFVLIKH